MGEGEGAWCVEGQGMRNEECAVVVCFFVEIDLQCLGGSWNSLRMRRDKYVGRMSLSFVCRTVE